MLCAADAQIWQRAVIQGFRACDAFMCGLLRGSHWGGFIAVRVVPVCEVEVGSAWSRRSWRATFRATKRLAIAENIYKSQRDSSLGLFAVCRADAAHEITLSDGPRPAQRGRRSSERKSACCAYNLTDVRFTRPSRTSVISPRHPHRLFCATQFAPLSLSTGTQPEPETRPTVFLSASCGAPPPRRVKEHALARGVPKAGHAGAKFFTVLP